MPDPPFDRPHRVAVHRRSPTDLTRLRWFLALLLLGLALATGLDQTMAGIESDLVQGSSRLPASIAGLVVSVVSVLYLALAIGAPVTLALTRRWRTLAVGLLGIALASEGFVRLRDAVPVRSASLPAGTETAFAVQNAFPPSGALATYTAAAVIAGVELPRRWQRAVWAMLGVLALLRVLTAQEPPLDIVLAIGVGGVVGTGLLLTFGRTVRVVSPLGVQVALERSGLQVSEVSAAELGSTGAAEHHAMTDIGPLLVKVVGQESQQLDSLYRAYRRVRLRDVGDDTAYSSARRAVAVESLLSLFSSVRGVRSPRVRVIAPLSGDDVMLAFDDVAGTSLRDLPDESLTDDVLRQCWTQVDGLRAALVAHRALDLSRLLLDTDGQVWLIDYSLGQPAADDGVLAGDVAELLAATYVRVGAARAVTAARDVLGPEPLAAAMARLVPAALTRQTRADLKHIAEGAAPLVAELSRVTGIDEPQLAKVERLKPRYLVLGVLLGVAFYVLLPQLANVPAMVEAVRGADWRYVPLVLATSALTYVGVALSMAGATPGRVSAAEYGGVAMASAFVATFAPPGIGHVGLNVRYLQKRGFAPPLAVSVVAAKEASTLVVHLLVLGVVAVWAGRSGALQDELDRLPPAGVLLAVGGAVLAAAGLSLLVPRVRRLIRESVVPAVTSSIEAMRGVARDPVKVTMLIGGAALLSIGYSSCLYFSVAAFEQNSSVAAVALVYLTAGAVASAAPTPGALGAVEALLLAALTGIGIASPTALAAVFLFRLATFWLPILPGLAAFRWLSARDAI